ncbi:(ABC) transporter [Coemansia spiralis]|uniref:(ABC) transporter n=2 Tax=Coemansia TaxID=4863 RepID=A0A9W8KWW6_9FUNG|nr:(ABC) transporter [Coemansia umbellata]KAJ2677585.1 (ABC) transporter [Coemansia spiralis]
MSRLFYVCSFVLTIFLQVVVNADGVASDNSLRAKNIDTDVYENTGTEYQIFIHKKASFEQDNIENSKNADGAPTTKQRRSEKQKHNTNNMSANPAHSKLLANIDTSDTSEYGGFNIDGLLDLMAGDEDGNVNFGAIGMELANNLATVIDMNEVGSLATTLGFMLSGIGTAAELQKLNGDTDASGKQGNQGLPNPVLNSGIAALLAQIMANQQSLGGGTAAPDRQGIGAAGLNIAQLLNLVAGDEGNGQNIQEIAHAMSGLLEQNVGLTSSASKKKDSSASRHSKSQEFGQTGAIGDAISGIVGSSEVRNIANALTDFVNGNDSSNLSGVAQAIGIRNFFKTEEKIIPEGCPSCFNCLYPGSVCAHNATCNQFTGRCDCPQGWTGEDCLQPACLSPLDEGKRPAAKSGHCHQDTECRPGWGGWNCNMCLTDTACDAIIPTGEGGRCYNGSQLITNVAGQCFVGNKGLSRYLPEGVTPKMTFSCDRPSTSCSAQFWISGKEAFYCDLDQCNIGTWGSKSTASINCKRMKCSCIPGRFLCGNYGLDISSVLGEVEGPVDIKCHDDGFSDCYIREFIVSKTLSSIIGDDAINMECSVGQCVHYSQLPSYQRPSHETSKGNMLIGIGSSLLTVYLVLHLIKMLVHKQEAKSIGWSASVSSNGNEKPISGEEAEDAHACTEINTLMMNTLRATVAFRDICYTIKPQGPDLVSFNSSEHDNKGNNPSTATQKHDDNVQVLKNISGIVQPGEILAILGASGAGKSTLLDILSRREKCGKVTGKVQINDRDLISDITTNEFHRLSGYVDQQDLHVATATVYEAVMTSALLRLPQKMSRVAKEERVHSVLKELGLWSVKDSRIGKNGARGISGGEMRRVSIACELVTSPSIIFLDEPTSGLDAYNAYVVMDTLSQLARRYGRTVICTIHQPRTDIFSMFDRLIVLAAGQMCYSGPASKIAGYLDSIGHPVPAGYNIADFSIDLVQQATTTTNNQYNELAENLKDKASSIAALQTKNDGDDDDEWSHLLETSQIPGARSSRHVSTGDTANETINKSEQQTAQPARKGEFLVYNTDVSLGEILQSFRGSTYYDEIMSELETATGSSWVPSSFDMVSSFGSTPYMRPVTPLQQIKVIFLNLYDLAYLLYCHIFRKPQGAALSDKKMRPPLFEQFKVLSARIFRHLYRDPTLMLANYVMSVFIGLMCGVLFYQLDSTVQGVQNRLGLLMFVLAFYGFGCVTSLLVFSEERLLYLRERANAYYDPLAYFLAKVTFDLVPLRVVPPLLLTLIAYPMTGLAATWSQFIKFFSTLVLFNLTIASQMFFIGLLAEELVVSNFLASIMLLFSLLFGGLILNKESIPAVLQPLTRFSSFNLAYEALAINELRHAHIEEVRFGLEIQIPTASLISSFGFDLLAFWPDIAVLFVILGVSLGLSLLWLTYVIKERR